MALNDVHIESFPAFRADYVLHVQASYFDTVSTGQAERLDLKRSVLFFCYSFTLTKQSDTQSDDC